MKKNNTKNKNINNPKIVPSKAGEYCAATKPDELTFTKRRYWSGAVWSAEYDINWEHKKIYEAAKEAAKFNLYWCKPSDLANNQTD